jgi:death on curing protein
MVLVWIREKTVTAIHSRQIAEHGGSDGIRDIGLLQSALARPQNLLAYGDAADVAALAAAYAYGIAKNHPFIDGNKRTALVVMRTFLAANDADFKASQEEKYITILKLAEGSLDEGELTNWVRRSIA